MRSGLSTISFVLVVLAVQGCTVTAGGFANENDELRFQVQELEDDLNAMTLERNEWRAKAEASATANESLSNAAVLEALPRVTKLDIDRLTGFVDRDGQPGYEAVDVYILPKDARDRFVQAVGSVTISLVQLPTPPTTDAPRSTNGPGSEPAPVTLATRTLSPTDLRDAYRNTLLSVHYSIQLTLDPPLIKPDTDRRLQADHQPIPPIQVVATFYDALTNETHTETMLIE